MPFGLAADTGSGVAGWCRALYHGELDQPVSFGGNLGTGEERESVQAAVQQGSKAQAGERIPARPGQLHGHCGKLSASLQESGIELGKGVS